MRAHRGRTLLLLCTALLAAAVIRTARRGTDPVTLEFAVFNGSNWNVAVQDSFVIVQEAMKRFGESHPGVSVHCVSGIPKSDYSEWLSRKILTDDAPDVMVVLNEDADRFVKLGILRNLDPLIEGSDGIDTGALFQTALRMGRLSGHQYCLPIETMPNLMFVNKSLLQKEGIDVPSTGYTFEDLYRICVQEIFQFSMGLHRDAAGRRRGEPVQGGLSAGRHQQPEPASGSGVGVPEISVIR